MAVLSEQAVGVPDHERRRALARELVLVGPDDGLREVVAVGSQPDGEELHLWRPLAGAEVGVAVLVEDLVEDVAIDGGPGVAEAEAVAREPRRELLQHLLSARHVELLGHLLAEGVLDIHEHDAVAGRVLGGELRLLGADDLQRDLLHQALPPVVRQPRDEVANAPEVRRQLGVHACRGQDLRNGIGRKLTNKIATTGKHAYPP